MPKITALLLCLFVTGFKPDNALVLADEAINLKPAGYYIAQVTDQRNNRSAAARLFITDGAGKAQPVNTDFKEGLAKTLNIYLDRNLVKNRSLRPVIINVKAFALTENVLPNGAIDGKVELEFDFGLQKEYGFQHLVTYKGGLHYVRNSSANGLAEQQLRNGLQNALRYFNNWMVTNAPVNIKLASKVKFNISDYFEMPENDTIYYRSDRLLTWADFQSTIPVNGRWAAEVMPGIGYTEEAEVKGGTVYVHIKLKTYLPKSTCWVKAGVQSSYALNHEQRHFDIARLVANRFRNKLLNEPLTPDTFEAFINMQYLDSYRELDAMQKAYDNETMHSLNTSAQASWDEKIDRELKPAI